MNGIFEINKENILFVFDLEYLAYLLFFFLNVLFNFKKG